MTSSSTTKNIDDILARRFTEDELADINADAICEVAVDNLRWTEGRDDEASQRLACLAEAVLGDAGETRTRKARLNYLLTWIEVWKDGDEFGEVFNTVVELAVDNFGVDTVAEAMSVPPEKARDWGKDRWKPAIPLQEAAIEGITAFAVAELEALEESR